MELSTSVIWRAFNNDTPIIDTKDAMDHSSDYHNLKAATSFLQKHYIWMIFAFGFPGNIFSLVVIVSMSRQKLKTPLFYVALLSVVDNTAIILKIIESKTHHRIFPMDELGCQFLVFCGLTIAAYSNWILVVMSAERFVAVTFPLRLVMWTLKKAVIVVSVIFLVLCGIHAHLFFTVTSQHGFECTAKREYIHKFNSYWFYVSSTLYAFVPASCIIICSVLIIRNYKRSALQRRDLLSESDRSTIEYQHQDRQITVMLVTVALVFLILTIPRCIYLCLFHVLKHMDRTKKIFVDVLTSRMADSTHAVNFYLYFIAGRKFRKFCLDLIPCDPSWQRETNGRTTTT